MLILGCLIVAFAFNLFFLRYNIVCFGISGLSIVLDKYGVNPSIFIMVANIILLIIAYFVLGKNSTKNPHSLFLLIYTTVFWRVFCI